MEDMARWRAELRVTCPSCGHAATFDTKAIIAWFRGCRWNTFLDAAPARFRCSECGEKPCKLSAIMPKGEVPPDRPRPMSAPPTPPGIDEEVWVKTTERERRKLVERLRS